MTLSLKLGSFWPIMTHQNKTTSNLESRKKDHLDLAIRSQTNALHLDSRFYYEPALSFHPQKNHQSPTVFLGSSFDYPFWVSSMTGGTEAALTINSRLAELCAEFNLGMGLGSIRPLLESKTRLKDFDFRKTIGDRPFYANLGVAQLEELLVKKKLHQLEDVLETLSVNGLFIHLNPLQEWFQEEGDRFTRSPIETIEEYASISKTKIMIKEVGHGMGPASLASLLKLPIQGIEFGAFGGTNFSLLEQSRLEQKADPLTYVGHTAEEMVGFINALSSSKEFIISGGIQNAVDGYYLRKKLKANSVIGLASAWLTPALESYESLRLYFMNLSQQYLMCEAYLRLKERES